MRRFFESLLPNPFSKVYLPMHPANPVRLAVLRLFISRIFLVNLPNVVASNLKH